MMIALPFPTAAWSPSAQLREVNALQDKTEPFFSSKEQQQQHLESFPYYDYSLLAYLD